MDEYVTIPKVVPLKIDGQLYELRELTVAGQTKYLKDLSKTMEIRMVSTGEKDASGEEVLRKDVHFTSLTTVQDVLLQACLFRVDDAGKGTPVPIETIRGWGVTLVNKLVAKATELNDLERPEDVLAQEAEKN